VAFSLSVRQDALVGAARHCCVCHRYKGVKVEVHHIVPQAQGGSDEPDNAIALCFDCHADAGHYNPDHPRGSKLSPEELRQARDLWHMMVRGNRIQSPQTEDWGYARYLICKSFSALAEIAAGDLHQIPVPHPLLVRNVALDFMRMIVEKQGSAARASQVYGDSFPNETAYRKAHQGIRVFERSQFPYYPYFRAFRLPDEHELRDRVVPNDPLSGILLDAGADPRDVCWALGYDELCGDGGFQELYRLRDLWAVFLELRNVSAEQLRLRDFIYIADQDNERFRPFTILGGERVVSHLPASPVLPGHSVLIPLASLLAPIERLPPPGISNASDELTNGQYQELDHVDYSTLTRTIDVLGPALWPAALAAILGDHEVTQDIHDLDLSNLYTLDRHWEAGSCPQLFFQESTGRLTYAREIFSRSPYTFHTHELEIPEGVHAVVLAELEHEQTNLAWIGVNGEAVVSARRLGFGESVAVGVRPGDIITLAGSYTPRFTIRQDPLFQNRRVWEFLQGTPNHGIQADGAARRS
jgi:hypothetical protein